MDDTAKASAPAIPVAFARVLRGAGVSTPVSAVLSFTEALGVVGLSAAATSTGRRGPRWCADPKTSNRSTAPSPRSSTQRAEPGDDDMPPPPLEVTLEVDDDDGSDDQDTEHADHDEDSITLRFSATEVLRHHDFADYSDGELARRTAGWRGGG